MGKKDVNNEIDNEAINKLIEAIEGNLSELKEIVNKSSAEKSEKAEGLKIEVGSKVEWEDDDGDDHKGEVIKIKEDTATVEDDDGDEHKVDLDDLELVVSKSTGSKSDKKEVKIEVGSEVEWTDKDGDDCEGEVLKIKGDVATVEDDDGDEHKVALEDLKLA